MGPSGRRGLWARALLACAALGLTLGGLEAGSRLFGHFEGPLQPLPVGNIRLYGQHDPDLFWSLRPGAVDPSGRRWINDAGLRGPEIGPKRPGEYRILSLGESTTFAARMSAAEAYSGVLEELLGRDRSPGRVRVLNAGVPGYSLVQGLAYLEHRAPALEPDMVLLYFGYNDFLPVAFRARRATGGGTAGSGLDDWELYQQRRSGLGYLLAQLTAHSNLYRGLLGLMIDVDARPVALDEESPRVPGPRRAELLHRVKAICAERRIELVVVVPVYREFAFHEPLLREFARKEGIAVVDLPVLHRARFDADPDAWFFDPIHPRPAAHRIIAESIFQQVDDRVPGG